MTFTLNNYKEIFKTSLNIKDDQIIDELKYNDIEEWDPLAICL